MSESARSVLKHLYKEGRMTEAQYEKIDRNLKEQPQWIPCYKRLPKERQRVLITRSDGTMVVVRWHKWWYEQMQCHTIKPIAWMLSPEPYEKEGDPNG